LLEWSDHIVVAQNPSQAVAEEIEKSGKPVIDLVGCGLGKAPVGEGAARTLTPVNG
jgi:hypothetical protein